MTLDATEAHDVLYRALETDLAAMAVYDAALASATNDRLRDEWQRHRDAKRACGRRLEACMRTLALDPDVQTASRQVVRHLGQSLAAAVKMAAQSGTPAMAEAVGAECVVHAELACRHQWSLVARVAQLFPAAGGVALRALALGLEAEQEEQVEHAERWLAELSLAMVGLPSAPPAARRLAGGETVLPMRTRSLRRADATPLAS
jgi:hypothetical protein